MAWHFDSKTCHLRWPLTTPGFQGKVSALLQYGDFRTWGWWSTTVLCQGKDGARRGWEKYMNTLSIRDILICLLLPERYWPEIYWYHLHNTLLAIGVSFCKNFPANYELSTNYMFPTMLSRAPSNLLHRWKCYGFASVTQEMGSGF